MAYYGFTEILEASAISSVSSCVLILLKGSSLRFWNHGQAFAVETWHWIDDSHLKPVPTLTQLGLDRKHHRRCAALPQPEADPWIQCWHELFSSCRDPETSTSPRVYRPCGKPEKERDRSNSPSALLPLHSTSVTWRIEMVKSALSHSIVIIFHAPCCPKHFSIQAIQTAQPFLRQFRPLAFSATGECQPKMGSHVSAKTSKSMLNLWPSRWHIHLKPTGKLQ